MFYMYYFVAAVAEAGSKARGATSRRPHLHYGRKIELSSLT